MNEKEWLEEFERYKKFPEWNQRQSMDLEEFKSIFFWEYGHRMMGRFLGVAFVVPMAYFGARGMIPKSLYPRLGGQEVSGSTGKLSITPPSTYN